MLTTWPKFCKNLTSVLKDRKETPDTYFKLAQNLFTLMSANMKSKRPEKIYFTIYQVEKSQHNRSRDGKEKKRHAILED